MSGGIGLHPAPGGEPWPRVSRPDRRARAGLRGRPWPALDRAGAIDNRVVVWAGEWPILRRKLDRAAARGFPR